jgi:two-component system OmpR family sensor kinase
VSRLTWVALIGIASILAVLGLVTWWMIRLGITPIRKMTTTAGEIAGGDLSARIEESSPAAESHDLAVALNTMLGTIQGALHDQAESEDRLRRFVSDASHELRTPVTTIRGYAELYRVGGLTEPGALDDAMRRTEEESLRMSRLVEDMLLLAKLDEQRPLDRRPVDMAQLATDAGADARVVAPDRSIVVDAAAPTIVSGDEDRLRQVFANLVGNAIAHTDPDSTITIRVRANDATATVEVEDTGTGMSPEVVERVTERFFRADPSRSRQQGGSGLGLAIVEATASAHGGTLRIDSTPGQGTVVTFEIPR